MNKYTKIIAVILAVVLIGLLAGCSAYYGGTEADTQAQAVVADKLASSQTTPTDIEYSLERYNLIRRAYWVNGQREKANMLVCPVEKPLGYIVLFAGNAVVGRFVVDGKVTSLNSFLTPSNKDEYVSSGGVKTIELADVDGSYGENDDGIFFFTPDGNYIEWTGEYLYSDIPFEIADPVVSYEVAK